MQPLSHVFFKPQLSLFIICWQTTSKASPKVVSLCIYIIIHYHSVIGPDSKLPIDRGSFFPMCRLRLSLSWNDVPQVSQQRDSFSWASSRTGSEALRAKAVKSNSVPEIPEIATFSLFSCTDGTGGTDIDSSSYLRLTALPHQ